jgi:CRP/FNR family transcriptional regulator, cyclic AMP receptor protein
MELINRMMDAYEELRHAPPRSVGAPFRMPQDEKMERLQTVPILQECTNRQLREVARIAEVVELAPGSVLTRTGDPGDDFFLIVDGAARVEVPGGKTVRLGPGEFFGEMSLLDGEPRSATITAETGIRLLVIRRRNFATLLKEAPALTLKILATLSKRVRRLEQALDR